VLEDLIPPIHIEDLELNAGMHFGYFDMEYSAIGKCLNSNEL
jgi:hypothetical protein